MQKLKVARHVDVLWVAQVIGRLAMEVEAMNAMGRQLDMVAKPVEMDTSRHVGLAFPCQSNACAQARPCGR